MPWARIENGRVAEITEIDPDGRFHPDITWYACDDYVMVGYRHDDGKFMPVEDTPSELTREQVEALRRVAYADPITGSDALFIGYQREIASGADPDVVEEAKQRWLSRAAEIAKEHPWP